MFERLSLNGLIALVSGGNRGIGYEVGRLLQKRGARVILTARSESDIKRLEQEGFIAEYLDVADLVSIKSLQERLKKAKMMPDILVNNAGIGTMDLSVKLSAEKWSETITTNLNSAFEMTKSFISHMAKKRYGRVINISSVLSHYPQKGFAHYSASKAGIEGFMRVVALEYAAKQVTVNSICPGFVDTDMLSLLGEAQKAQFTQSIPVGYMASAEDVAEMVAFVASPAARYMTGECIQINGGMYMR